MQTILQRMICGLLATGLILLPLVNSFPQSLAQEIPQQAIDDSIARALAYLSAEQQPSGAWLTDAWGESPAITSLAVMAFLAAGHVPGEGPYGEQINKGIRWVIDQQQPSGLLIRRAQSHGPMYDHGIATLMLAEVSGMVDEADAPVVRRTLEKAVRLILQSQAVRKIPRHQGGWRYQFDSLDSDLSVTVWQVMALRAAKDIGCDVPAESIDAAVDYVKKCEDRRQRGFGYQPGNGTTPTMTGSGITCLEVCGTHQTEEALAAAQWLLDHPLNEETGYLNSGTGSIGLWSKRFCRCSGSEGVGHRRRVRNARQDRSTPRAWRCWA
jgi:hypothetical protein